ncbi:MAG TPA: hypothetical protein DCZ40_08725 [Lachnospiraceae bacterium]|nr:hypothetical protein [Lachnospiraceae bacterium]
MKKERVIGIVIAAVNAVLMIVCAALYLGMDRTEPRFEFQASNMIYREGMDISEFINGVSAYDDEDGDITDRIVVEKLIKNREENSVIVFYAVSDKAGNVVKSSREFSAIFMEEEENENVQDRMSGLEGEVKEGWLMQTGFWNDLEGSGKEAGAEVLNAETSESGKKDRNFPDGAPEEEEEENGAEEDGENDREAASGEEAVPEEEDNREAENAAEERNAGEGSETAEEQIETDEPADGESRDAEEEAAASERSAPPVLTLQVSEIRTRIGVAPAWVEVIGTLSDDRDSYETLFRNLDVSKYDINQAGTYQVTVSTRDSDGNRSQAVPLTIIVK